jgi:uncharacterized protein YkwD
MNRPLVLSAGLLGLALMAGACATRTPTPNVATATAAPTGQAIRGLAVVDRIEIAQPDSSSGRASVTAHGQLADACTSLTGATVERTAQTIVVTLGTLRQPVEPCAAVPQPFAQEVALDLAGLPAGDYVVVVNGVSGSLALDEAEIAPTPSPTAPPVSTPLPTPETLPASPSPEPTTASAGAASNCIDRAGFYGDISVPDDTVFKQGEAFVKGWKVRNEGTCTWKGYTLVFAGGDQMSGPLSSPLPETPPDTTIEISVKLIAPTRGGSHVSNWEFEDAEGRRFGVGASQKGPVWVRISVNFSGQEEVVPGLEDIGAKPPPTVANPCGAARSGAAESQVLGLINSIRTASGLGALSVQPQLSTAAAEHSADMACHDFISHTGTDGTSWKNRIASQGYANYNSAREIIYAGAVAFGGDPQGAFDWWMASQTHHDIILYDAVSELGIASMENPNQPGMEYYTVVFARP